MSRWRSASELGTALHSLIRAPTSAGSRSRRRTYAGSREGADRASGQVASSGLWADGRAAGFHALATPLGPGIPTRVASSVMTPPDPAASARDIRTLSEESRPSVPTSWKICTGTSSAGTVEGSASTSPSPPSTAGPGPTDPRYQRLDRRRCSVATRPRPGPSELLPRSGSSTPRTTCE